MPRRACPKVKNLPRVLLKIAEIAGTERALGRDMSFLGSAGRMASQPLVVVPFAAKKAEPQQGRAKQRQRTGLRNRVGTGEEEWIDQPGRIDAVDLYVTQPGKHPVERVADRGQEIIVAEFAVGSRAAGCLQQGQRREG